MIRLNIKQEKAMKKIYSICFILAIIIALPNLALSKDYFVATNGNELNPGTESEPWLTIQHAADLVSAGDNVFIKAGTYTENISMNASGTSGNEIVFRNYASDSVTVSGQFNLTNRDYIKFLGLTIRNGACGFYENQTKGSPGSDYITIENCTIQNTSSYGIHIARGAYVTVSNCTIKDTGNSCINSYGNHWLIEDNDISNPAVEDAVHLGGNPGVHTIRRNYLHDVDGGGHADGIQLVCSAQTVIEYNIIENTRSQGIMVEATSGCQTENFCDDIIIRYNLFYSTRDFEEYNNTGFRINLKDSQNSEIVGNTFAYNYTAAMRIYTAVGHTPSGIIKNNIFYKNGDDNWIDDTGYGSGDIDYNCYYGSSQGTLSQNEDNGEHSINVDPQFVDDNNSSTPGTTYSGIIASDFLKISSGSPARDNGTSYSGNGWLGVDLAGTPVPHGTGWDMGAYECVVGPSAPINLRIISD